MHLVSIIMPVYNGEKYIAESIRSAQEQTYRNWELIVTDDGSVDGTAEIVRAFCQADPRVRYVYQPNGGLGNARNTGIRASRGELVAFLDADDLWLREKLALQTRMMEEMKASVVFSDAFIFPEDDVMNEERSFATIYGRFKGAGRFDSAGMYRLLLEMNPIPVLTVLLRRDLLDAAGRFEEDARYRGCEDYELWFKLAERGAVFYGHEGKLARYRFHSGAMSRNVHRMYRAEIAVLEKHRPGPGPEYDKLSKRIKETYRLIISFLIKEERVGEAAEALRELSRWDRWGSTTLAQRALIRALPRRFNSVSERLYKAEQLFKSIWSIRGRRTLSRLKGLSRKLRPNKT
jgi:glycosyltransferase involved in cell wall biosynthesis